jgi:class 3 adenylate cyclase
MGAHVKTIGDAVMLRVPEPADAVRLGLWITHDAMRDHGSPAVRVGLHHGHAIERWRLLRRKRQLRGSCLIGGCAVRCL